jgi:hypothetical protein
MKKLHSPITSLIVVTAFCFFLPLTNPIHAAENSNAALTASVSELRVLNTIENHTPLTKGEKYLSVKVRLVSSGKTPAAFPLTAISLKTPKGKRCEIVGIGSGKNDFSAFNVYLPFTPPWYPFSMSYQDNDETKLFGIKQKNKNDVPEFSLLSMDLVLQLGFVIPANTTTFDLNIGAAKTVKLNIKAAN